MRVRVTKPFDWAADGNHPRTVAAGEVLDGRGGRIALELKCGEEVPETEAPAGPPKHVRLPTREEYVAAGYEDSLYAEFIRSETARAEADGVRAEVRAPTPDEASEPSSRSTSAEPTSGAHSAPIAVEPQPTAPSPESQPTAPAAESKRKNRHGR